MDGTLPRWQQSFEFQTYQYSENMVHKTEQTIPVDTNTAFSYNGSGKEGIKLFIDYEVVVNSLIDNLYKSIKPVMLVDEIEDRPILVGKSYEGSTGDNGTFSEAWRFGAFDKRLSALELDLIYKSYQSQNTSIKI